MESLYHFVGLHRSKHTYQCLDPSSAQVQVLRQLRGVSTRENSEHRVDCTQMAMNSSSIFIYTLAEFCLPGLHNSCIIGSYFWLMRRSSSYFKKCIMIIIKVAILLYASTNMLSHPLYNLLDTEFSILADLTKYWPDTSCSGNAYISSNYLQLQS